MAKRCKIYSSKPTGDKKMSETEARKMDAEIAQIIANTIKLGAETAKLNKETAKINKETFWYPMALATGLVIAVGAVVKYIL
jgi:hypothetical protein